MPARTRQFCLASAVALLVAWVSPHQASAQTVHSLDYFFSPAANTCTARDPAALNTWHRQYKTASPCSGYPLMYKVRKGGNTYPFGSEHFLNDQTSGFIEILNEITTKVSNGAVTENRVFRDKVSGEKGALWIPTHFNKSTGATWVTDIWVEYWFNASWNPSCSVSQYVRFDFSSFDLADYLGVWQDWIQDKRASSPNKNAWHDVEVIVKTSIWGSSPEITEKYYYGRWWNPGTSSWEGVGLVRFQYYTGNTLTTDHQYRYLTDCSGTTICPTCPP